ncbi:Ger(x)C family spore germination protein [Brevibacillus porteri]|uniref:Ger(X)C family spore germination protein n=1 Tax=Brevibacillus porteri TaxID=2126350 RepID=A0ABX5FQF5_9BACL|nr:Ger(x)C family spore germination protein [Brevibacillus porteri]MED1800664.1 Ger(x)C family spore germination protein [Brevibacillus porteri]MED2134708.1 Ger(x)C family spore germination protein [Brevibacillus porteri]MED2748791.1 Ger(x)C family spore germination protein [Brevibacillus porteri]MED2818407.1 Ger(x)C family spore germination protein [Brevibacillus porteri]MED2897277.1 Ger(x)C family spore germination protein [Brevibacillus porteri]
MKKLLFALLSLTLFTTGCMDKMNIEDVSLSLLIGIDLDENNNLIFSTSSPVFSQEAKIKEEVYISPAITMRESREEDDKTFMALTVGGKVQAILVGKRVMQHKGWLKLLEPLLRDPKNSITGRIVMVDGNAYDVISYLPKDKPRLPLYLTKLIDTAHLRNICTKTTLQDLRRATYESGITANVTEIKKEKRLFVTGTALLGEEGEYKFSLAPTENKLLRILQHDTKGEFSFTFKNPNQPVGEIFPATAYSFSTSGISVKTKTDYVSDKFKFDINVQMRVVLTERLFKLDIRKEAKKLEQEIEQEMTKRMKKLIHKIQTAKIDPIGLGIYARAYEYEHWKPVKERWGETLAKADVKVSVKVIIAGMGISK